MLIGINYVTDRVRAMTEVNKPTANVLEMIIDLNDNRMGNSPLSSDRFDERTSNLINSGHLYDINMGNRICR